MLIKNVAFSFVLTTPKLYLFLWKELFHMVLYSILAFQSNFPSITYFFNKSFLHFKTFGKQELQPSSQTLSNFPSILYFFSKHFHHIHNICGRRIISSILDFKQCLISFSRSNEILQKCLTSSIISKFILDFKEYLIKFSSNPYFFGKSFLCFQSMRGRTIISFSLNFYWCLI